MQFGLLSQFASLFEGQRYLHRNSTLGDSVAQFLYEDLCELGQSAKFVERARRGRSVLNSGNRAHGVQHRRGDGTFGTIVPGDDPVADADFLIQRGPIANVEIGVEVKILAKAMIKQIDRVRNDLKRQAAEFRKSDGQAICVAVVGVNHADLYRSFEGERQFVTNGRKYKHPASEAEQAIRRLAEVREAFDEMLVLRFEATNMEPFPFSWVDPTRTRQDYGALLVRASNLYENRF